MKCVLGFLSKGVLLPTLSATYSICNLLYLLPTLSASFSNGFGVMLLSYVCLLDCYCLLASLFVCFTLLLETMNCEIIITVLTNF